VKKYFLIFSFLFYSSNTYALSDRLNPFCIYNEKVPEFGQKSKIIGEVQYILFDKYGYFLKKNNVYDESTKNAIKKFQHDFGINETGVLDEETWKRMRLEVGCNLFNSVFLQNIGKNILYGTKSSFRSREPVASSSNSNVIYVQSNQNFTDSNGKIQNPEFLRLDIIKNLLKITSQEN
jgi:hypothetical protein